MISLMHAVHHFLMLLLRISSYLWFRQFDYGIFRCGFLCVHIQDFLVSWIYEFIFIAIFGKTLSLFTPLKYFFSHLLKFQVPPDIFPIVIDVCFLVLNIIFSDFMIEQFPLSASPTISFAVYNVISIPSIKFLFQLLCFPILDFAVFFFLSFHVSAQIAHASNNFDLFSINYKNIFITPALKSLPADSKHLDYLRVGFYWFLLILTLGHSSLFLLTWNNFLLQTRHCGWHMLRGVLFIFLLKSCSFVVGISKELTWLEQCLNPVFAM